jgi:dolichol-phosphate mannosyltransferase
MNNCFLSIVTIFRNASDLKTLPHFLEALSKEIPDNFSDYEVIVTNNSGLRDFYNAFDPLPSSFRQNVFLLNLSSQVLDNHAIISGLERSNGDYTVILEPELWNQSGLIRDLYLKSVKGWDIVYLRASKSETSLRLKFFHKFFHWILNNYSTLKIDKNALLSRVISRRALNSLLKLREDMQYLKAAFSTVGYNTSYLEIDLIKKDDKNFGEKFKTSLIVITSFTTFLRTVLLWIFLVAFVFMVLVIINSLKVKFTNIDLFGTYHETITGWTFLVVLVSIFFAIICLILYIMSIYLSNIYQEIKYRPKYNIESFRRLA